MKKIISLYQRNYDGDRLVRDELVIARNIEGIVWHHPDGRMVKIKARDFGLPWPPR